MAVFQMTPALATANAMHALHQGVVVPDYEKLLQNVYARFIQAGDTVVDIGAHAGRHTSPFADIVGPSGQVIAFEPIPHMAEGLRRRFGPPVEVRELALADFEGSATFSVHPGALEHSSLITRESGDCAQEVYEVTVKVSTLDVELQFARHIRFIKLDVEGGEIAVLHGAAKVLGRTRPFIDVEYGEPSYVPHGHQRESLYEWCVNADYIPSDLFGNFIRSRDEWSMVCDRSYWDYMLVPSEKVDEWISIHAL